MADPISPLLRRAIEELTLREALRTRPLVHSTGIRGARGIVSDNRFKTQHEVRESKGLYDPEMREELESRVWPGRPAPIYGALGAADILANQHYGPLSFVFKPHVKRTATWTPFDSLDQDFGSKLTPEDLGRFGKGRDIQSPTWSGMDEGAALDKPVADIYPYVEVQMHRKKPLTVSDDVERFLVTDPSVRRLNNIDDIIGALKDYGVPTTERRGGQDIMEFLRGEGFKEGGQVTSPMQRAAFGAIVGNAKRRYADGGKVESYGDLRKRIMNDWELGKTVTQNARRSHADRESAALDAIYDAPTKLERDIARNERPYVRGRWDQAMGFAEGGRTYMPYGGDYSTYGQGPAHAFFDQPSIPLPSSGTGVKTPTATVNPQALSDNAISNPAWMGDIVGGQAGPQGSAAQSVGPGTQGAIGGMASTAAQALGAVAGLAPGLGTAVSIGNAINGIVGPTAVTNSVTTNGLSTGLVGPDVASAIAAGIGSPGQIGISDAIADAMSNSPGQGPGGESGVSGPDSSGQAAGSDSDSNAGPGGADFAQGGYVHGYADGGRTFNDYQGDYTTYGAGPEFNFFSDGTANTGGTPGGAGAGPAPTGVPVEANGLPAGWPRNPQEALKQQIMNAGTVMNFDGTGPGVQAPQPQQSAPQPVQAPSLLSVATKYGKGTYCQGGRVWRGKGALR